MPNGRDSGGNSFLTATAVVVAVVETGLAVDEASSVEGHGEDIEVAGVLTA